MPTARVNSQRQVNVTVNQSSSGLIQKSARPVTISSQIETNTLEELNDVSVSGTPANGYGLVYNSVTDKYEVTDLATEATGDVDGGTY